jgi:hypothetical protein
MTITGDNQGSIRIVLADDQPIIRQGLKYIILSRHILGMAKTPLNNIGSKARSLRLDLLELITAVQYFKRIGEDAQGYMVVSVQQSYNLLNDIWLINYNGVDDVTILLPNFSAEEVSEMSAEKTNNSNHGGKNSKAKNSEIIGEINLELEIGKREPNCIPQLPLWSYPTFSAKRIIKPLNVNWDYYGIV